MVNSFGPIPMAQAQELALPKPGVMVHLSPAMNPPMLKGIKVHTDNPFRFDFILDKGDDSVIASEAKQSNKIATSPLAPRNDTQLKEEANRLIKYFLASLTIPEKDLWVNLSPYEKDRIVPESFGVTEMGRDLLAQDYMLKQITASLIYPEDEIGKKFWKRIYEEAQKKYNTTNIPVNTFNKVWIVPEKAVVYENLPAGQAGAKAGTAYVVESRLKVMLEADYLSMSKHNVETAFMPSPKCKDGDAINGVCTGKDINALGSQIVREIVIPELTKEINEGKNFSQLRQVYNSLILATWYKKKIKDSILAKVYADKSKVEGVEYENSVVAPVSLRGSESDRSNLSNINQIATALGSRPRDDTMNDTEVIYQQYLQAFKKGVYNYIKEEIDPVTQESMPKKYFSGGVTFLASPAMTTVASVDPAQLSGDFVQVTADLAMQSRAPITQEQDRAMRTEDQAMSAHLGGRTTLEVNVTGVNKALALDYLDRHWRSILKRMGYTPGEIIDAMKTMTAIVADGDGTTYGIPSFTDNPLLADSIAYDALLEYLRLGGVYVINSGNDIDRTVKRLLATGKNGKPGLPVELRNRVLVVGNGGATMGYINQNGDLVRIEGYQNNALGEYRDTITQNLDTIYLGDDIKKPGNDYRAFQKVGFHRAISVASAEDALLPEELRGNHIGGLEEGVNRLLIEVNKRARLNPQQPIFTKEGIASLINQLTDGEHQGYKGPEQLSAGVMPDGDVPRETRFVKDDVDTLVSKGGRILREFLTDLAKHIDNKEQSSFADIAVEIWEQARLFHSKPDDFTDEKLIASKSAVRIEIRGQTSDGKADQVAIVGIPGQYREKYLVRFDNTHTENQDQEMLAASTKIIEDLLRNSGPEVVKDFQRIANELADQLIQWRSNRSIVLVVDGISAGGKTTLIAFLLAALIEKRQRANSWVTLDDFMNSFEDRVRAWERMVEDVRAGRPVPGRRNEDTYQTDAIAQFIEELGDFIEIEGRKGEVVEFAAKGLQRYGKAKTPFKLIRGSDIVIDNEYAAHFFQSQQRIYPIYVRVISDLDEARQRFVDRGRKSYPDKANEPDFIERREILFSSNQATYERLAAETEDLINIEVHLKGGSKEWKVVSKRPLSDEAMATEQDSIPDQAMTVIPRDAPFTITNQKENQFDVKVQGRVIRVQSIDSPGDKKFFYFHLKVKGEWKDISFLYTKPLNNGLTAIRGVKVDPEFRNLHIGHWMVKVLLHQYPRLNLLHSEVRDAVLMSILIKYFQFKPSVGARPNAYYMSRPLTKSEIEALGYTVETFPKNKRTLISRVDFNRLIGDVYPTIRDQYLVVYQEGFLEKIKTDPQVTPLYLGEALIRDSAQTIQQDQAMVEDEAMKVEVKVRDFVEQSIKKLNAIDRGRINFQSSISPDFLVHISDDGNNRLNLSDKEKLSASILGFLTNACDAQKTGEITFKLEIIDREVVISVENHGEIDWNGLYDRAFEYMKAGRLIRSPNDPDDLRYRFEITDDPKGNPSPDAIQVEEFVRIFGDKEFEDDRKVELLWVAGLSTKLLLPELRNTYGGIGVELTYIYKSIGRMGGHIEVNSSQERTRFSIVLPVDQDSAQLNQDLNKGGIDFNSDKMNLETRNEGEEIKFKMDPAMLQQLQNAPGFYPVIINIQPMTDIKGFLGINDAVPSVRSG